MAIATKILLVRPARFGYNPQTAESNSFQQRLDLRPEEISRRSLQEFDRMVATLRDVGVDTVVLEDKRDPFTPDAIFPNNWFSTHPDKTLCLYPMESAARRLERDPAFIARIREEAGTKRILDLSANELNGKYLEGTGSLVLDHENGIAYASVSTRTDRSLLADWCVEMGFRAVTFQASDAHGTPVYHTNVVMCLGDRFAVVCLGSIADVDEKASLVHSLEETGKEIVDISDTQMAEFAGNMLQLGNRQGDSFIVMSARALSSLRSDQIRSLERFATLIGFDIPTIEACGGGSVRCMIAELF